MQNFLCLTLFSLSGLALTIASGGEPLNINSEMELGRLGAGVPGCNLVVNKASIKEVNRNPDKIYLARTSPQGKNGRCMEIPGYVGMSGYQLEFGNFRLQRDGEVQISFDAKITPDETGKWQPERPFNIDFRCFPDMDLDRYYPMLAGFTFRPGKEWQHFSKRFNIKAYPHYYNIWILPRDIPSHGTSNTLLIDNFRLEYTDSPTVAAPDEYAAIPDRDDPIYTPGDHCEWELRAKLHTDAATVPGTLEILREHDRSEIARLPVNLKRDSDGVYTARSSWKIPEYGSFVTRLAIPGRNLRGVNSSIVALHPVVNHPELTPGWGLGANNEGLCPFGRANIECVENFIFETNGFERSYRLLRQSGISLLRIWGTWRLIEPVKDHFTTEIFGLQMDLLKKYQITPLFCLVGNFPVHGGKATVEKMRKRGNYPMPLYLYDYFQEPAQKQNNMGALLPPLSVYDRYLQFVLDNWGDRTRFWEMSNEPGLFGLPAANYIEYLKHTSRELKKRNPQNQLLGNGVTGDFGMNVVKWCDQLNAVDPDYVDSLDIVAFHPYNRALDDMKGMSNRYRECVQDIQKTLKKNRPMWATECYYLPTARRKQTNHYMELSRFGANELLRHYLDGMLDGVTASPTPSIGTFFTRPDSTVNRLALNETAAAQNALSFLLKDMKQIREIPLLPFVRAGIFTGKDGQSLGFLYGRRSDAGNWLPGKGDNVVVRDLYGNALNGPKHPLSWEPYFLTGPEKEVEKALRTSEIDVTRKLRLRARKGGNTLWVEAENLTGRPGSYPADIAGKKLQLSFPPDTLYAYAELSAPAQLPDDVELVAASPLYRSGDRLTLRKGTQVDIRQDADFLVFTVNSNDTRLKAAPGRFLWEGSAVEIFFDPAPERNLKANEFKAIQYVFAVRPSQSGHTVFRSGGQPTRATRTVELLAQGYRMTIRIPLAELPASKLYGFEVEIDRDGRAKDTLGGNAGLSFRRRLHYSLLQPEVPLQ